MVDEKIQCIVTVCTRTDCHMHDIVSIARAPYIAGTNDESYWLVTAAALLPLQQNTLGLSSWLAACCSQILENTRLDALLKLVWEGVGGGGGGGLDGRPISGGSV